MICSSLASQPLAGDELGKRRTLAGDPTPDLEEYRVVVYGRAAKANFVG